MGGGGGRERARGGEKEKRKAYMLSSVFGYFALYMYIIQDRYMYTCSIH